jgi:hypothetical protein
MNMHKTLTFKLTSEAPILLHNGQLADPTNKWAKEMKKISSKRNKTESDFEELARLEWLGSLYTNKASQVVIPDMVVTAALLAGAKKFRLGKQAQAGLFVFEHARLEFDGDDLPLKELWERDENRFTVGVNVQRSKVMRTRFIAHEWQLIVPVTYEDSLLNESQVLEIADAAGTQVGLCDWRPRYGRFTPQLLTD